MQSRWNQLRSVKSLVDQHLPEQRGASVLVRVDYNVPLKDGKVLDDTRIRLTLPTLQLLLENGWIPILLSHLGRPQHRDPHLSLQTIQDRLQTLLNAPVFFCETPDDAHLVLQKIQNSRETCVVLLENTRYDPGEKTGDRTLAEKWASLGSWYVNEAFSVSHRKDTSVYVLPQLFPPDARFAGLRFQEEIMAAHQILSAPSLTVILGGAKISDKLPLITALIHRADRVLIGGAMATTFLVARNISPGRSFYEKEMVPEAHRILIQWKEKILLPEDVRVLLPDGRVQHVPISAIPEEGSIIDVGPSTLKMWEKHLVEEASCVFWNGPLGKYEEENGRQASEYLVRVLNRIAGTRENFVLVGGGDTAACVRQSPVRDFQGFLSSGGGAMLELIARGTLPGLEVLLESTQEPVSLRTEG